MQLIFTLCSTVVWSPESIDQTAVGWLLRYIARHSFRAFGYYRIVAGIVVLALLAAGVLG